MEEQNSNPAPRVIIMDVYDTILNMSEIEKYVNTLLNSSRGFTIWFGLMMQYSFVDNCTDQFHEFSALGKATLQMAGKTFGIQVKEGAFDDILHLMKHLPLHNGVSEGLTRLNATGCRISALTNSPKDIVLERMERTGLISYFDKVMSSESIKKYKPSRDVYAWAAKGMDADPTECLFISAHAWDIAGAQYAGMITAYIKRPYQMAFPLAPEPTYTGLDINVIAQQIEERLIQ